MNLAVLSIPIPVHLPQGAGLVPTFAKISPDSDKRPVPSPIDVRMLMKRVEELFNKFMDEQQESIKLTRKIKADSLGKREQNLGGLTSNGQKQALVAASSIVGILAFGYIVSQAYTLNPKTLNGKSMAGRVFYRSMSKDDRKGIQDSDLRTQFINQFDRLTREIPANPGDDPGARKEQLFRHFYAGITGLSASGGKCTAKLDKMLFQETMEKVADADYIRRIQTEAQKALDSGRSSQSQLFQTFSSTFQILFEQVFNQWLRVRDHGFNGRMDRNKSDMDDSSALKQELSNGQSKTRQSRESQEDSRHSLYLEMLRG